jgi:hypothetical protein
MGLWSGGKTTVEELGKGFHYVLWVPALCGLFWFRRRMAVDPGLTLLALLIAAHTLVLWRLGTTAGYVSERHTVLIVACGLVFAVAAIRRFIMRRGWSARVFPCTICVLAGLALLSTCQPLHSHRVGHKEAGFWLAGRLRPQDQIVDPYGWVTFYSGRTFERLFPTEEQRRLTDCQYLVVEPGDPDLTRQDTIRKAEEVAHGRGKPIFSWPAQRPRVIIFEQHVNTPKIP